MTKVLVITAGLIVLVVVLSSCSRNLRPTAGAPKKNGNNAGNNNTKSSPNIGNFAGTVLKNVVYTNAVTFEGINQDLVLDVYKPANAQGKKFPAIFLFHGGTFIGGDKNGLASTCSKLANNGYIAISVNYRLGWGFVSKSATTCDDSTHLKQAIYRSVQDAHSAMRYIAAHADEYNVDKNWIFIGGQSAGAITALITAYLQQQDAGAFFPGLDTTLGLLDKSANTPNADFKLKGVISMWGAFIDPNLITQQTALPTIFFQGELDKAVPFRSGTFVPCSGASPVYGTYPLYDRLKDLGQTAIAHVDPQGGHGVFEEDFRIQNIVCFLNNVQQGTKKQVYLTGVQNSCDKQ
jgi:acetyl esterase/lipase